MNGPTRTTSPEDRDAVLVAHAVKLATANASGEPAPVAGHQVTSGTPAIAYEGAVDLYLGLLAGAGMLLSSARRIAEDLGMDPLHARTGALGTPAPAVPHAPGPPAPAVLRLEGEVWTVTLGAETVRVRDVKGMHYLRRLLSDPGREFHVLDLAAANARGTTTARAAIADGLRVDGGGSGPLLDAQAKDAYRRRLHELRAEAAEAEDLGHHERAAEAQEEIAALAHELARAVGLGGRDRPTGSAAERARVNVSRALRSAIGRIARAAPSLGHHLGTSVRTGTYCRYAPDPASTPDWET